MFKIFLVFMLNLSSRHTLFRKQMNWKKNIFEKRKKCFIYLRQVTVRARYHLTPPPPPLDIKICTFWGY